MSDLSAFAARTGRLYVWVGAAVLAVVLGLGWFHHVQQWRAAGCDVVTSAQRAITAGAPQWFEGCA